MEAMIEDLIKRTAKAEAENIVLRIRVKVLESKLLPVVEQGNPFWWCAECSEEVDDSRVTFQERHDTCGNAVILKYDAAIKPNAAAGEEDNLDRCT